ncbi:MAG: ABC transporter permease subunit [Pseudomonadota bacterium]
MPRWLAAAPGITIALLLVPVCAGVLSALLPALGYFPAFGGDALSLGPFSALFTAPGIWRSIALSAASGLASALIAVALTFLLLASAWDTPALARVRRFVAPLLSVPHAAAAIGLAFLVAPSGFLFRLVSPFPSGLERPPDLLIINDPFGLAMIAGLVAKEMPFLLLMAFAALPALNSARRRMLMTSLGYSRSQGFFIGVAPELYRLIRLPVFAVIAYASSSAEIALILGPTTPSPLPIRILQWSSDPDLGMRFVAAAGAVVQIALTLSLLGIWIALEKVAGSVWRIRAMSGRRAKNDSYLRTVHLGLAMLPMVAVGLGLALLAVWSFAGRWRFPDAWPATWSFQTWSRVAPDALELVGTTALVAVIPTFVSLVLIIACLEVEQATGRSGGNRSLLIVYIPLLVPQVSFLFGLQFISVLFRLDGLVVSVMVVHLIFILPYMFLSLADPYRRFDSRYLYVGAGLGMSYWHQLFSIRLPMMVAPILTAIAIGIAVSIGQYLPTLLIGAGRVPTLTTEAVALAAGGDRRTLAVAATLQALLPFVAFWLAVGIPAHLARRRQGMQAV